MNGTLQTLRRVLPIAIAVATGAACLYYLVEVFPWAVALDVLAGANWPLLLGGSAIVMVVVWMCRAVRFYVLARAHAGPVSLSSAYLYTAIALGLNVVTGFQLGEAFKMRLLRTSHQFTVLKLARLFIAERVMDFAVLALLTAASASAVFTDSVGANVASVSGVIGLIGYIAMAAWPAAPTFIVEHGFIGAARVSDRLSMLGVTILGWLGTAVLWWVALTAVEVSPAALQTLAISGLVSFATALSAIPAGLGISEVSTSFLLETIGVAPGPAHAAALSIRVTSLVILALGALHLLAWWLRRKPAPDNA